MVNVKYVVELTDAERSELQAFLNSGSKLARKVKRAQVLLAAEQGYGDEDIANMVGVGTSTVYRAKKRFVERVRGRAGRRPSPWREPQAHRQGGSAAGRGRVLKAAVRMFTLDDAASC